ncbi:MAG: TIGR03032 family protein [Verrucomicrobia bacterium]|nr:MAG: TIGR03032 family protein [Verrucomicrobiota bacterium]
MSGGLLSLLGRLNISLAVTSYQSGRLYLLGRNPKGGLMVNEQYFRKAMGLCYHEGSLYLAALGHIYRMENCLRPQERMDSLFTQCFLPRTTHLTGQVNAHDVGISDKGEVLFVNTRYNCISTLSDRHSFRPVWKPSFISKIIAEDRCHLNGMAMAEGRPRFVTAVSKSDTIDGWRDRRSDGGIVMDVEKNSIVCEGLSMPHSPRLYRGKLWVLNSGTGELGVVNMESNRFEPLVFCPGFLRGLSFHENYAFVGLSRPRYERFEGLALEDRLKQADSEPWTGVQVIDLTTGSCVQWFRIDGPIAELYDVAVLPDIVCAKSFSPATDESLGIVTIADEC